METRKKQTIPLEKLKEIGKATLDIPSPTWYLSEDIAVVVAGHQSFLVAIAPHTKRLNAASVSLMAKSEFQLGQRESKLFGDSIAAAYSHCLLAGSKAITGQKLPKEVWAVYQASGADGGIKEETMKSEAMVKSEQCSPPPKKQIKVCLSSPSQIASLYSGGSSSVAVKVMGLCVHDKHKHTGCINMCPSSVYHHIQLGGLAKCLLHVSLCLQHLSHEGRASEGEE